MAETYLPTGEVIVGTLECVLGLIDNYRRDYGSDNG